MRVQQSGLKRISFWKRIHDRLHPRLFGDVALPPTLGRSPIAIHDQAASDFCTAFCTSEAGGYLNGIDMSPEWQAANEGKEAGQPIIDGTDPHTAMQAALDRGFLPASKSPYTFQKDGWVNPADWMSYSTALDAMATGYRPGSRYAVACDFDAIKEALFAAQADNGVVMVYGFWFQAWTLAALTPSAKGMMPEGGPAISRHAYLIIDWRTIDGAEYLVAQLSQGAGFGDGGLVYLSRSVFAAAFANPILNGLGCYTFRSQKETEAEEIGLYQQAIALLQEIVGLLSPKTSSISRSQLSTILAPLVPTLEKLEVELEHMEPTHASLLVPFCSAIAQYEGADLPGARPYRNCNPGDLRWPYGDPLPYGATAVDSGQFLIFPNYAAGFAALKTMVTNCASGKSRIYHPTMTIVQFFDLYAPSDDSNDPNAYARFVGERIGVDPTTYEIKSLIA